MEKLKIGSVGLGRLGEQYAENIANRINGAELTALCDMDEKKLKEVSDSLGVKNRFTNFDEMLKLEELDAVRRECSENFLERFEDSYVNEVQEFVDCIKEGRKPEVTAHDGTRVSEIAYRCKESFETGEMLKF